MALLEERVGKRANGEGSVYQRTDGRWCASVTTERSRRQHFLVWDDIAARFIEV